MCRRLRVLSFPLEAGFKITFRFLKNLELLNLSTRERLRTDFTNRIHAADNSFTSRLTKPPCRGTACRAYRSGYACGSLGRKPCIQNHLGGFATKAGEKCGLIQGSEQRARSGFLLAFHLILVLISSRKAKGNHSIGPCIRPSPLY